MPRPSLRMFACLVVVGLMGLGCPAAQASDDDRLVSSLSGTSSGTLVTATMHLPAAWRCVRVPAEETALNAGVLGEGDDAIAHVSVAYQEGIIGERGQAYIDRESYRASPGVTASEVRLEPRPHVMVTSGSGGTSEVRVVDYRMIRGMGFRVICVCSKIVWPDLAEEFFTIGPRLTARTEFWPRLPSEENKHYRYVSKSRFTYVVRASRSDDLALKKLPPVNKLLCRLERDFAKRHGRVLLDEDHPGFVIVHFLVDDVEAPFLGMKAKLRKEWGCSAVPWRRRLFVDTPSVRYPSTHGHFALAAVRFLYALRYGTSEPLWLSTSEASLAYGRAWSGKDLPIVTEFDLFPSDQLLPFDEIQALRRADWKSFLRHGLLYRAVFEQGPGRFKEAFRKFVKDFRESGDWRAAQEEHLLSLDQDELLQAARIYLTKRMKVGKPKPERR